MTVFWFWTCSMSQCRAILSTSRSLGRYSDLQDFFYQAPSLHELWSPDVGLSLIELWGWSKPIVCADAYMPSCCLICKHATPSCHLVPFQMLDVYVHVFIGYHLVTQVSPALFHPIVNLSVSWFGICILLGIGIDWSWKAPQFLPSVNYVMAMVTSLSYQIDLFSGIFPCFWILWWFLALIYFMVIPLPLSHVKTRGRWLPYDRVIQSISLTWNSQVGNHTWY